MFAIDNFGIIGGDKRQIAMAESISSDGYNVNVSGFEKINFYNGIRQVTVKETILNSKYIILPLPVIKINNALNAPYSNKEIILDDDFAELLMDKMVFCGIKSRLTNISDVWNLVDIHDYSVREDFAIRNAVPTAEGAVEIAMSEYPGTINGSRCLVAGFGRIGKVLSKMLTGIGADLIVSARSQKDIAYIESLGYKYIKTENIKLSSGYDIIFNTIPYMIFDAHTLALSAQDSLVIDLASAPGGVDIEAATRLGIKSIQALSLPGKVAPKKAGEIIKKTIYNIIEEEET